MTTENKQKNRIILLDVLRGVLMIWVLVDHFFYDFGIMYSRSTALSIFARDYWNSEYRQIAHPIVLFLFFFLSGICARFSKNALKRAVKLLALSLALFLVTFIFDKITGLGCTITFGVLYVFTVCAFVSLLIDKLKINKFIVLIIGIALTAVGILYEKNVLTFLSKPLYFIFHNAVGYTKSADYFPLLPYLGYYLIGFFIGVILYKEVKPKIVVGEKLKKFLTPISFVGKTSLWWYFISQGVYIAVIELLIFLGVM